MATTAEVPAQKNWKQRVSHGRLARDEDTYAGLALPVPRFRVELVGHQDLRDDVDDLVSIAGQHDGLGAQADGADFGDDAVCDGADRDGVSELQSIVSHHFPET